MVSALFFIAFAPDRCRSSKPIDNLPLTYLTVFQKLLMC
jgi:hypothetical protein